MGRHRPGHRSRPVSGALGVGNNNGNFPRVPFRQVMTAETLHPNAISATFIAVIVDPDTQKVISKIPICELSPGETVELALERRSNFVSGPELPTDD